VAAYRDEAGALHAVSSRCTHLGCTVGWNDGDKTWDCPCHGSRYDKDGKVIQGPAEENLAPVTVKEG
jgi:Rieske Fe-S protein